MTKTTLYLEDDTAKALQQQANDQGCSESDVVREALAVYQAARLRSVPKGVGGYRSGRSDISSKAFTLVPVDER
jgi:predicted transcriptional regulator